MHGLTPDFEVQITSTGAHYTEPFAAPDKIAVMLNVENTAASGSNITVTPQHSNDEGRNWLDRSAIISSETAAANSVTGMFGSDNGSTPIMALMRLKITASPNTPFIRGYLSSRTY